MLKPYIEHCLEGRIDSKRKWNKVQLDQEKKKKGIIELSHCIDKDHFFSIIISQDKFFNSIINKPNIDNELNTLFHKSLLLEKPFLKFLTFQKYTLKNKIKLRIKITCSLKYIKVKEHKVEILIRYVQELISACENLKDHFEKLNHISGNSFFNIRQLSNVSMSHLYPLREYRILNKEREQRKKFLISTMSTIVNEALKQLKFTKFNQEDSKDKPKLRRMLSIQKGNTILPLVIDLDIFSCTLKSIVPHEGQLFICHDLYRTLQIECFLQKINKQCEKDLYWQGSLVFNLRERIIYYESQFSMAFFYTQAQAIEDTEARVSSMTKMLVLFIKQNILMFQKKHSEIQKFITQSIIRPKDDAAYSKLSFEKKTGSLKGILCSKPEHPLTTLSESNLPQNYLDLSLHLKMYEINKEEFTIQIEDKKDYEDKHFIGSKWEDRNVMLKEYTLYKDPQINKLLTLKELQILALIPYPYVVKVYGVSYNYQSNYYLLYKNDDLNGRGVMIDLAAFIKKYVKRYNLKERKILIQKLAQILVYLNHKCSLIHANLTPYSVFVVFGDETKVDEIEFRIANFESSFFANMKQMQYFPRYPPKSVFFVDLPIFLQNKDLSLQRLYKCDVYSFGILAMCIYFAKLPETFVPIDITQEITFDVENTLKSNYNNILITRKKKFPNLVKMIEDCITYEFIVRPDFVKIYNEIIPTIEELSPEDSLFL